MHDRVHTLENGRFSWMLLLGDEVGFLGSLLHLRLFEPLCGEFVLSVLAVFVEAVCELGAFAFGETGR